MFLKPIGIYTNAKEPFGEAVAAKFPGADTDVEEAGKCLALERPTAAVFHLGRAVELAMHALASSLNTSTPSHKQWQTFITDINNAVARLPTDSDQERERKSTLAAVSVNLYHIKLAWRNNVLHPKESYSLEEANEIYKAVVAFMRHLAENL